MAPDQEPASFSLPEQAAAAGYELVVFDATGSTNDAAFELAQNGSNRTWVVAKEQTAGRGRHGRRWQSPPGNLYASLLLVDLIALRNMPQLGLMAGVALAQAVQTLVPDPTRIRLKWPNDILFDGAKLAGVLIESRSFAGRHSVVIGFGVNCRSSPEHLPYGTAALTDTGARICNAEAILSILSERMLIWLSAFEQGFDAARDTWLSLAAGLGEPISVKTAAGTIRGVFQTIDPTGRLVLADETGAHTIETGDVVLAN